VTLVVRGAQKVNARTPIPITTIRIGAPLRPANLSSARYVGSQPNLEIRWAISEHFLAALNVAGFITGTFLQQSPPSKGIVFFNAGLTYRF
jgi:hypothetical protein